MTAEKLNWARASRTFLACSILSASSVTTGLTIVRQNAEPWPAIRDVCQQSFENPTDLNSWSESIFVPEKAVAQSRSAVGFFDGHNGVLSGLWLQCEYSVVYSNWKLGKSVMLANQECPLMYRVVWVGNRLDVEKI